MCAVPFSLLKCPVGLYIHIKLCVFRNIQHAQSYNTLKPLYTMHSVKYILMCPFLCTDVRLSILVHSNGMSTGEDTGHHQYGVGDRGSDYSNHGGGLHATVIR